MMLTRGGRQDGNSVLFVPWIKNVFILCFVFLKKTFKYGWIYDMPGKPVEELFVGDVLIKNRFKLKQDF